MISLYWDKFFYGNHVYGNISTGTPASVSPFTANDLQNFHKAYYNPQSSAIAVVGDFNTAAMKTTLEKLFADWKKTSASVDLP